MNPDQTAPKRSSLIWVHIVAIYATEMHEQKREQMAIS